MFSEAVDQLATRGGFHTRERELIIASVNAAIRSLDSDNIYLKSTVEDSLTITDTAAVFYTWQKPPLFKRLLAVKYVGLNKFIGQRQPGKEQQDETYYWYEQAENVIFNGTGGNTAISVFYAERPKRFKYYAEESRPAVYDEETYLWTYPQGAGTAEEQEAARNLVSHWLLKDWWDAVLETALSIIWKDKQHESARSTFALANRFRNDIKHDEQTANYEYL